VILLQPIAFALPTAINNQLPFSHSTGNPVATPSHLWIHFVFFNSTQIVFQTLVVRTSALSSIPIGTTYMLSSGDHFSSSGASKLLTSLLLSIITHTAKGHPVLVYKVSGSIYPDRSNLPLQTFPLTKFILFVLTSAYLCLCQEQSPKPSLSSLYSFSLVSYLTPFSFTSWLRTPHKWD